MSNNIKEQNPCAKSRTKDKPYEIWKSRCGQFEYRVLKKYQAPSKEAANPQARWYLATKGPGTFGTFELGDGWVRDIKANSVRTYRDPSLPPE